MDYAKIEYRQIDELVINKVKMMVNSYKEMKAFEQYSI
jgi:hypothetical protein